MVQKFVSIIGFLLINLTHTYGNVRPLWFQSPYVPKEDFQYNCAGWLVYHSIKLYDTTDETSNRSRALIRDKTLDPEMQVWAACYAYFISSFSSASIFDWIWSSNLSFCDRLIPQHKETSYVSLGNANLTCADWIHHYGYDRNNTELNKIMADGRNQEDDSDPHLFVAMYSRYAYDLPKKIGMKKSCKEWIELSGYSDNEEYNLHNSIQKAMKQNHDVLRYLSRWTVQYIDHLLNFELAPMRPGAFCYVIQQFTEVEVYYDRD